MFRPRYNINAVVLFQINENVINTFHTQVCTSTSPYDWIKKKKQKKMYNTSYVFT